MSGSYFILEGADCAGKTTLAKNIQAALSAQHRLIVTKHPGATPVGQYLRTLVKDPASIDPNIKISPLSAQLLLMVDQNEFKEQVLDQAILDGKVVIADRCNLVSAIIYGMTEGIDTVGLNKLYNIASIPKPDRVFILSIDPEEAIRRKEERNTEDRDRFEDQGKKFIESVCDKYNNLTTLSQDITLLLNKFISLDKITYINANNTPEQVCQEVLAHMRDTIERKQRL
jgi:dTMP kinase